MIRDKNIVSIKENEISRDIKIIIFLLMLISLGIGLTKTYFTAVVALEPDLNITMGTFQFNLEESNSKVEVAPINISELMPGGVVTKEICIKNTGTLNGKITVRFDNFSSDLVEEELEMFLRFFSYELDAESEGVIYGISYGDFSTLRENGAISIIPEGAEKSIILGEDKALVLKMKIDFNCGDITPYNGRSFTFDVSIIADQENYGN